jgi:crossover junction endodeoxyribonuclease RuvC
MRVIGIDPGTVITGWGVVEYRDRKFRHIANGSIRTTAKSPLPDRLGTIFRALSQIIGEHQPTMASVEEVFVSRNVQSALKLGHARGVAIAAANQAGLPIHEYTALQVKKSVVGYGRAEKSQVQEMVKILLCLPKIAQEDASDALAAAMCHINHAPPLKTIAPHKESLRDYTPLPIPEGLTL